MNTSLSWYTRPYANTKVKIFLRIRDKGDRKTERQEKRIDTNIVIDKKYWKGSSKGISKKIDNYTTHQEKLNYLYKLAENVIGEIISEGKYPYPNLIAERIDLELKSIKIKTEQPISYNECWKRFLKKKEVETTFYTYRMYKQLYQRLNEFGKYKKRQITFDYLVSEDFELEYKEWSWKVREHKDSYVRKNLTSIKSFMNYCYDNQLIKVQPRVYKKPKETQKKEVVYLKADEVRILHNANKWNYVENKDYGKNIVLVKDIDRRGNERFYTNWELVKDIMVFMCLCGCRWNDIHTLTWDEMNFNDETFTWLNQKTKKWTTIPLDEMGITILKKYGKNKSRDMQLFPNYSSVKFNKQIKKVCKELNLNRLVSKTTTMGLKVVDTNKQHLYDVISSHCGRRTFIMGLINKGLGYKEIMSLSGHSDIKSLMKYISVGEQSVEKGRNLFIEQESSEAELVRLYQRLEPSKQKLVLDMMANMV